MARVSPLKGPTLLLNDDTYDEPRTPMTGRWADDQAPLRTTSPETIAPSPPSKRKGKERAIEPSYETSPAVLGVTEVDIGGASPGHEHEPEENQTEALVTASYPPATEEAIEEQKVNEVCSWFPMLSV